MPSNTSVGSYVDVNLDTMNGGTPPQQKYVTFDDDSAPMQPFANSSLQLQQESLHQPPSYSQPTQPPIYHPQPTQPPIPHPQPTPSYHPQPTQPPSYHPQQTAPQLQQPGCNPGRQQCLALEPPKLEQIKKWTVTNYKYTKQLVSEKFGHSTKTVDKDLEEKIEALRQVKVHYSNMLREARALHGRYDALLASHRNMKTQFQTMIAHSPELQDSLHANAATQAILEKNGEGLLGAMKMFVDTLNTLVNVTMQDTFLTIKHYENARVEYDAYRNDIAVVQNAVQTESNKNKQLELQVIYEDRRQKWERLKQDTHTKISLLHENKTGVMKQQLDMFNSAVIAYFTGNGDKLSEVLSEYHIKTRKTLDDETTNSFLARSE